MYINTNYELPRPILSNVRNILGQGKFYENQKNLDKYSKIFIKTLKKFIINLCTTTLGSNQFQNGRYTKLKDKILKEVLSNKGINATTQHN